MSNYTKTTNFASKDNLSPGNPLKIVKGTEIDTEFNNIATAVATKTDNASANITGGSITGITDLAIADGGTGASTANAALNNLLPSQASASGKYLKSNGTDSSWDALDISTADITGTLPVANGGTGVTTSTGTGAVVLSNSPTLVTPALGTPSSGTATNLTGLPISTGVSGLGTGVATFLGTPSSANLASAVTDETGSGALVFANSPTLVTPALGTPASATLTNATGLPISTGVSGLGTGVASFLATPSSANLATAVSDETGSGALVFANSPTLVTPALGTPSSATLTNATGLPISSGVSGLGTGVATALAVNVGSAGAPVVNGGVLGTPSSGTATNLTDLPIATGVSGLGTGVATALAVNVGSAGAAVVNGGALGTPSSGTATNLTGLPLSTGVTGTLPVANGGTGQTSYTDGQLLIGNSTGNTLSKATLTAGSNITITNGNGSITIASTASGSGDVVGPASSTDNAFARFDSTTGKLLQDSTGATLSDTGGATFTGSVDVAGTSTAGSNIKLYEDTDNGTNYVAFKAPDTIAANVTWTLPSADGTSGQILSTNGSGTLSWADDGGGGGGGSGTSTSRTSFTATAAQTTFTVSYVVGQIDVYMNGSKLLIGTDVTASSGTNIVLASGAAAGDIIEAVVYSSQWVTSSTNLYYTAGNVGIGTSSPTTVLHTVGTNSTLATTLADSVTYSKLRFQNSSGSSLSLYQGTTGSTPAWYFQIANGLGTSSYDISLNPFGGNVGIGTSSPAGKLHVEGGGENAIIGSSTRKLYFRADSNGVMLGTGAAQTGNSIYFNEASNYLYFSTASTERARIDSSGRLLVGLTSANTSGSNFQVSSGVTFPATQSASSDANTLDDYEEGTWTPVLKFDTNTQGITINGATYVKIGSSVSINMSIAYGSKTGSGRVYITGLPFAKGGGGTVSVLAGCSAGTITTTEALFYNIDNANTILNLAQQTGDISSGSLAASGSLFCSGTYFV